MLAIRKQRIPSHGPERRVDTVGFEIDRLLMGRVDYAELGSIVHRPWG